MVGVTFPFKNESSNNYRDKLEAETQLIGKALEQKIERRFDVLNTLARIITLPSSSEDKVETLLEQLRAVESNIDVLNVFIALKKRRNICDSN